MGAGQISYITLRKISREYATNCMYVCNLFSTQQLRTQSMALLECTWYREIVKLVVYRAPVSLGASLYDSVFFAH